MKAQFHVFHTVSTAHKSRELMGLEGRHGQFSNISLDHLDIPSRMKGERAKHHECHESQSRRLSRIPINVHKLRVNHTEGSSKVKAINNFS